MSLADPDLEQRLRDQRHRAAAVAPAPRDLADRTRARFRAERRRRIRVGAAVVAVVMAVVGVPTLASTVLGPDRGLVAGSPDFYDLPTRGSLAGDEDWIAGMAAVDWGYDGTGPVPDEALPSEVRPEDRRVAFAGDVPTGRIALVLGRAGAVLFEVWFAGPSGAEPNEMTPVTLPWTATDAPLLGLWDRPTADEDGVLILLADPDATVEFATGHVITDDGHFAWDWRQVEMEEGVSVSTPDLPDHSRPVVARAGSSEPVYLSGRESDVEEFPGSDLRVDDPRGLLDRVQRRHLDYAIGTLRGYFGLPASELRPTLLWAGPGTEELPDSSALIGVTLPSGATAAIAVEYQPFTGAAQGNDLNALTIGAPAPPGTELLDRVMALMGNDWILVSAPRGVTAEFLLDDGTVSATVPLSGGAGAAPFPQTAPFPSTVRVLDADGDVVGEAPAFPETGE